MKLLLTFLAISFLAACGGDDDGDGGPGAGPVGVAQAEVGCRRSCEHDIACNPSSDVEACTADCVDDVTDGYFRADVFEQLVACIVALPCERSNEECLLECEPTGAHENWETQCREVFSACGSPDAVNGYCETTPQVSGGDPIGFFCVYTPALMVELTACVPDGATCEDAQICIDGVLESNGVPN